MAGTTHNDGASVPQPAPPSAAQRSGQPLAPGLYVVATPIGNLRDITLRALDVLGTADRVLAEDTRRTGRLLTAHGIKAEMMSYHDHNAAARVPQVLDGLRAGEAIALVSDAGTPLVSDPGYALVRAAREADLPVYPVPGASAAVAALSVAGLPSDRFTFAGFLPPRTAARRKALAELAAAPGTLILYETGPRLAPMLSDASEVLGARDAAIARELTKIWEEVRRGPLARLAGELAQGPPPKGEIVAMIGPGQTATWDAAAVDTALTQRAHLHAKDAAREVAALSGWSRRDVYQRLQGRGM